MIVFAERESVDNVVLSFNPFASSAVPCAPKLLPVRSRFEILHPAAVSILAKSWPEGAVSMFPLKSSVSRAPALETKLRYFN